MIHQYLTDDLRDRLILYALDVLGPEETQTVAAHLEAGCTLCMAELQDVERVVGVLGYRAPAVRPQPEVRTRLWASLMAD